MDKNHLRRLEKGGNHFEDFTITLEVIKGRHHDEHNLSSIDDELARVADGSVTQPEIVA